MDKLLKRLGLIEHLKTELDIEKNEFIDKLRKNIDEGSTGILADTFDIFSSSNNLYKGKIWIDKFKIKKRRTFFEVNLAVAKGTLQQNANRLIIDTEIDGFSSMMIFFYALGIFIYSIMIGVFVFSDDVSGNASMQALPFILLHASFMFGIPYFMMRRSVQKMKQELEREFYYIAKK